jgi:hypothetical protein
VSSRVLALLSCAALAIVGVIAWAQSDNAAPTSQSPAPDANGQDDTNAASAPADATAAKPGTPNPTARTPPPAAAAPPIPTGPPPTPPNAVLVMTGLDKITGRPTRIVAHLNQPVHFATFTITARYCYSTPASETPETSAFVQIDDHRPDQRERRVFSGWMYASSPGLNAVQHPLYDVWVISCSANAPGQTPPTVASVAPVRVRSPDSTDTEGVAPLHEGAGQ